MSETRRTGTDAIKSVVVKMKELATQAQDDQITDARRAQLVTEYNELQNEIDYVAKNTEYDGTELIDGSFGSKTITIDGANEDQDIDISLGNLTLSGLKIGEYENDIGGGNTETISASTLNSAANAADAVSRLEDAIETLDSERANQISKIERFDFTISHMERMITINEEAIATINDFDEAAEMAKLTGYRIEQQTAIALMAQAQQLSAGVLQLLQG